MSMSETTPIRQTVSQKRAAEIKAKTAALVEQATPEDFAKADAIVKSGQEPAWRVITPKIAAVILTKHNLINRDAMKTVSKIDFYARQMATPGTWRKHHQGLAFYSDGTLADGQHRLYAIVVSEAPQEFLCTPDFNKDSIAVIDNSKPRNAGSSLELVGVTDSTLKASIMRDVLHYEHALFNRGGNFSPANPELIDAVQENDDMLTTAILLGKACVKAADGPLTTRSASTLAAILMAGGNHVSAIKESLLEMQRGESPYGDCPTTAYARVLFKAKNASSQKDKVKAFTALALGVKAFQLRQENKCVTKLTWNPKREELPDFRPVQGFPLNDAAE